jgi:hypothetical protein
MADLDKYYLGDRKVIKTNRGKTYVFEAYFPKEEPEGIWEDLYRTLVYLGIFD